MINIIAITLRTVALGILLSILPIQLKELRIERNGLRFLKLYLFLLTLGFTLLDMVAVVLLADITINKVSVLTNTVIILNGMGYFLGSVLLYLIYHRKF